MLDGIEGLAFVRLGDSDVVRNRIVREIVSAYDRSAPGSPPQPAPAADKGTGPAGAATRRNGGHDQPPPSGR